MNRRQLLLGAAASVLAVSVVGALNHPDLDEPPPLTYCDENTGGITVDVPAEDSLVYVYDAQCVPPMRGTACVIADTINVANVIMIWDHDIIDRCYR